MLFPFGDFFELPVDLRAFLLGQFQLRQPAFVVNPDCRAILDGPADVVDVDVIAKHGLRVLVAEFNRRSGESQVRSVRQRVAQMLAETVADFAGLLRLGIVAVLAAVGFVGDDDDIPAIGKSGI